MFASVPSLNGIFFCLQRMTGFTRKDAALDAMRQFGFGIKLVRETVDELLDVGFLFS